MADAAGRGFARRVASVLAKVEAPFAGRAFAAYGGIYIAMSLLWGIVVEKKMTRPF